MPPTLTPCPAQFTPACDEFHGEAHAADGTAKWAAVHLTEPSDAAPPPASLPDGPALEGLWSGVMGDITLRVSAVVRAYQCHLVSAAGAPQWRGSGLAFVDDRAQWRVVAHAQHAGCPEDLALRLEAAPPEAVAVAGQGASGSASPLTLLSAPARTMRGAWGNGARGGQLVCGRDDHVALSVVHDFAERWQQGELAFTSRAPEQSLPTLVNCLLCPQVRCVGACAAAGLSCARACDCVYLRLCACGCPRAGDGRSGPVQLRALPQ